MSDAPKPSSPDDIQRALTGGVPLGRWREGLMFEGINPTPGLKSAANWFPRTEKLGPDEIRIIFMGTAPFIRLGQMNTSIMVQLGNGENFIFDIGEGSIANYIAAGFALNELDRVFITHLHIDHFGSLPYLYMFGGWAGRWHKPLRVFGPSGRTAEYGTAKMVEGMQQMLGRHMDAFSVFPVGQGHDIEVNEFDFRDNGGVIYDEGGVEIIHWQRSHAKDGASGYRLNWNGMSVVWTDFDEGRLVVPHPPTSREEIQEPFVRDKQIDPSEYYPEGYHPDLMEEWPVEDNLVVPLDAMPDQMLQGMGESWRDRQTYKKHISQLTDE